MPNISTNTLEKLLENKEYEKVLSKIQERISKGIGTEEDVLIGVIAARELKRYNLAISLIDKALEKGKKDKFIKAKALLLMEMLMFDEAQKLWAELFDKDEDAYAYYAACAIIKGDPFAGFYVKEAYLKNKDATKRMLKNIYEKMIKPNPYANEEQKREIEELLKKL